MATATPFPDEVASTPFPDEASTPFPDEAPKAATGGLGKLAKDTLREGAAAADVVWNLVPGAIGLGADMGMRARAIGQGKSHRESAQAGTEASQVVMEKLGSPFHKLMEMAGMGTDAGGGTGVDAIMGKASSLLAKGGEWVEKHTGGAILKEDVESITNAAMEAGGARGMKAGLEKLAPDSVVLGAVKFTPEAMSELRQQRMQKADPHEAVKMVEEPAAAAVEASAAKTRIQSPKDLVLDPITGELSERAPEPGKPLPKPTSLETALDKVAGGRSFDLTAEERIAYKGWKDEPLAEPLVDEQGKPLRGESGSVDPKLLARLAAVGLGAWAGQYFSDEHDLRSAVVGGVGGLLLSGMSPGKAAANFKKMMSPDTRLNVRDIADAHEKYTTLAANNVWALQKQIEELVPEKVDRETITHAIEAGKVDELPPKLQKAAKIARGYFDEIGEVASLEGVLKSAKDDYVTHIWDWSQNDKSLVQRWLDKGSGGQSMGSNNRFAKERSIGTIAEGKEQGLKPLTEDISHIMGIYGNSMSRSIANSIFTRALKAEKVPGTEQSIVMTADKAPHSYVSINNAAMQGLRVHPDIAPSLKMLYDTSQPGAAMKIMQGLSDTSKRVAVSFSLFHAKALTDAMIGGSSNPFKALGKIPGFVMGTDKYLQELRRGSASPLVERAAEGGLKFSLEHTGAGVEDAGAGFYGTMSSLQGFLDKTIPGAGLPIKAVAELNHKVDTLMWSRLHAGMKLNMFAEKYQQLLDNSKGKLKPDDAARIAASYTNDLFGGLNWRRIAEDAQTRFGREVGQATLNPGARRVLQLVMFAPDWTLSTTRAAVQAFGKPDFLRPTTLAGLHQQYLIRAGLYYLVVGDAINYSMSGHHLWQNKDPTTLDMDPKGERKMQWSKHTMEPVHWLTKPGQQGLNKLGMMPREALEQGLGVEYLSSKGRMPPIKNRAEHALKNFVPIAGQQAENGVGPAVSGFLGAPIYGMTAAQKEAAKRERQKRPLP